ncbi:MAG: adenine deaminase [Spirochaetaceae bacterium]|nr:MAG: adenine deaminase [Spirochaetaceae bacterium]
MDLLLEDAQILDVELLSYYSGWVGVRDGRFARVEEGRPSADIVARTRRSLNGARVLPGLIDSHMHIESSLVTPRRFAELALVHGTTTVLADPHEVANVAGAPGIRWMIEASRGLALRVFHAIPSCVPATEHSIEWTAHTIDAAALAKFTAEPDVLALGEMMDYQAVLAGSERHGALLAAARQAGLLLEGHIPTLSGEELSEYLSAGVTSDHTLTRPAKLREQLRKGCAVMLQWKSLTAENLASVMALPDRSRILLITDDIEPTLLLQGHLSSIVQRAVELGMPETEAVASATVRPARYLGLRHLGMIAPGYEADFLVSSGPGLWPPSEVYVAGELVAQDGEYCGPGAEAASGVGKEPGTGSAPPAAASLPPAAAPVPAQVNPDWFRFDVADGTHRVRTVVVETTQTTKTHIGERELQFKDGFPVLPAGDDIAVACVVARDESSYAVSLLEGSGFSGGAFASSFAHDSHNFLAVGSSVAALCAAGSRVCSAGGGVAVVAEPGSESGTESEAESRSAGTSAFCPLPVMGLLSDEPVAHVAQSLAQVEQALRARGVRHERPFLLFSLLSLSVSPLAKFSDRGIVDTEHRRVLGTFLAPAE